MAVESLSQPIDGSADRKPIALETSSCGMIFALLVAGCGTTPIEAVIADAPADAPTRHGLACDEPAAGRFTLSVSGACLRRGGPLNVASDPAFASELSADCTSVRAQWDVTPAVAGTFTLRNAEDQWSLDVRGGSDLPGTPIIISEPNTLDNQRFWFRPRSSGAFELAARHAPALCADAHANGLEIWPCAGDQTRQAFRFARVGCL